jgi:hypothetical protein
MHSTTTSSHPAPIGRRIVSVVVAIVIAAVLQFAAVAKVSAGARALEQLKAAQIAESHGLAPRVTADDFQWAIRPGAMPGTLVERGVLLDIAIGTAEFAIVLLMLAFCRHRIVWMAVPVLFAGLFGYALHRTLHGHSCGCFGALWEPPKGFSLVMDGAFVLVGLALARWHGLRAGGTIAVVVVSLAAAGAGYVYAANSAPPKPVTASTPEVPSQNQTPPPTQPKPADPATNPTDPSSDGATGAAPLVRDDTPAAERLLVSPMLDDLRNLTDDDAAWYIFVWDPTCPTCEAMLPVVQHYATIYAEEGNPVLQVRDLQKQDIAREAGIEDWQWTSSPAVVIVRGGRIIAEYGGDGAPFPDAVQDRLFAGEPIDDLQRK